MVASVEEDEEQSSDAGDTTASEDVTDVGVEVVEMGKEAQL